MTLHTEILPPPSADVPLPASSADPASYIPASLTQFSAPPTTRYDGWTPERQRVFLQAISEGLPVVDACRAVGLTKQSAYALRRSARGAGFALGWQAATLLAREAIADTLMERFLEGNVETITRPDGTEIERHRFDNRLGMALLTRLDRLADAARTEASHAAARLVAAEFDQYLDLVGKDAGPGRAGLFLGARLASDPVEAAGEDDLAPIRALARADRWLRTHTDLADGIDTADLDPAMRAGWNAGQWARAEAVGLVQFAPPAPVPPAADSRDGTSQLRQLRDRPAYIAPEDRPEPVWWDEGEEQWFTRFPPPDDFLGEEDGDFGQHGYSRTLDADEIAMVEAPYRSEVAARRVREDKERRAWFAARCPSPGDTDGKGADHAPGAGRSPR